MPRLSKSVDIAIERICEKTTLDQTWLEENSSIIETWHSAGMNLYDDIKVGEGSSYSKMYTLEFKDNKPKDEPYRLCKIFVLEYEDRDGVTTRSLEHVVFPTRFNIDELVRKFCLFYERMCVKLEWYDTARSREYWAGYNYEY